jgi:hypothetical protein
VYSKPSDVSLLNLSVVSSIFVSASSCFFFLDRVSTALKGTGSSETKMYLPPVTQHEHTADGYNSGVTVKLPGISCNGNKVQVHGLDIVEGKINNDDVSVLRDTISSMTCQMICVSKLTVNKYSRTSCIS